MGADELPARLIGDKAYDSDRLDRDLLQRYGIELIAPHRQPRHQPHAQGNRSDKPVRFVVSGTPAGFEKMFPAVDALMKRSKPGTPEFTAEIQEIAARCDMVILGPAPK